MASIRLSQSQRLSVVDHSVATVGHNRYLWLIFGGNSYFLMISVQKGFICISSKCWALSSCQTRSPLTCGGLSVGSTPLWFAWTSGVWPNSWGVLTMVLMSGAVPKPVPVSTHISFGWDSYSCCPEWLSSWTPSSLCSGRRTDRYSNKTLSYTA